MKADPGYARYFAYLNLFVVFMLVLVLGSSFPVMFIGWEGVGLCSYLLIGFWFSDKVNADAGKKAFIVNRIGDFGFMVAMFLIWHHLGTLTFTGMVERAPAVFASGGGVVTAITLFLFLGCTGKSAQIPLYTWLPDAMAGPDAGLGADPRGHHGDGRRLPGGPYQRAVRAGAALQHRRGRHRRADRPVRGHDRPSPVRHQEGAGVLHRFPAGLHVRRRGNRRLYRRACSTWSTHAFFKALLFLGAGSVIHAMHHAYHATHSHADAQDMRNMGGLKQYMPVTFWLMLIATLAIAGVPPFAGLLLQGRDPGRGLRPRRRSSRSTTSSTP